MHQTHTDAFNKIVDSMPEMRVLVVGDIMLDRFVYGDATRLSPEAPVPVLRLDSETAMLGGAGNVLSNLHGLNIKAFILSVAGNDSDGEAIRAQVAGNNADPAGILTAPGRPTTVKTRYLAGGQQLLRVDSEDTSAISPDLEDALLEKAATWIKQSGAVIFSDYCKGVLTPRVITEIITLAEKADVPVLVDSKRSDLSIYKAAAVLKPNHKELGQATGLPVTTAAEIAAAATALLKKTAAQAVVATRAQDGMTIVTANETLHLAAETREATAVSGAGDTVIAVLAAALAAGADLTDAARLANIAAGIVVTKTNTAPISHDGLLKALSGSGSGREAPVATWAEAADRIADWRAQGLRVGFTNGCFDILHPGHVGYLNRARDKCDRLVIGLNADASVRRLKGETRPVNQEQGRATVLAALGCVDLVVLFGNDRSEDDKPVRLIDHLRPDIFFKGGDYREDQLPEAQTVRAYGGDVLIMPLYEGHSTTGTIQKLKLA